MKHQDHDFEVGDYITITKGIGAWNSAAGKAPHSLEYPFTGKVESIGYKGSLRGITVSGYGFSDEDFPPYIIIPKTYEIF